MTETNKSNVRSGSSKTPLALVLCSVAVVGWGCASKGFVETRLASDRETTEQRFGDVDHRVGEVESQVEQAQTRLDEHGQQIDQLHEQTQTLSRTTQEALDRAMAAGKLAKGKFLYETVLTDDKVHFGFDKAVLSDEAKSELGEFANQLTERNENVYVEIQGHTDSIGTDDYNYKLGEQRAEAVRRYLNQEYHFPLHRMSVISYGETASVVPNDSREHRAQNRRVSLVVLE